MESGREGKSWRLRAAGASLLTNIIIYTNYFISSPCSSSRRRVAAPRAFSPNI